MILNQNQYLEFLNKIWDLTLKEKIKFEKTHTLWKNFIGVDSIKAKIEGNNGSIEIEIIYAEYCCNEFKKDNKIVDYACISSFEIRITGIINNNKILINESFLDNTPEYLLINQIHEFVYDDNFLVEKLNQINILNEFFNSID